MKRLHLALAAAVLAAPVVGAAQTRPALSIGVAGLYASLSGDDFQGTNAGMGLDAQFRVAFTAFSIGGGFQFTSHDVDGADNNLGVRGIFLEPRYQFAGSPALTPYVMGRVSLNKESLEDQGDDFEAGGTAFGAGGGLLVRATPSLRVDIGVSLHSVSFGDVEINGVEVPNSDASGSALVVRVGVLFALGRR